MENKLSFFEKIFENSVEHEEICATITKGQFPFCITGVSDVVSAHIAFSLCKKFNKKLLFISSNDASAKKFIDDFEFLFEDKPLYLPERELMFYDVESMGFDIKKERLNVINKVSLNENVNIITTVKAVLSPTISKEKYLNNVILLSVGDEIELKELSEKANKLGYSYSDSVEGKGQFSVRGGIFDFFPFWSQVPFRIDFFDTEIESIRTFDIDTQRTIDEVNETSLTPVYEEILDDDERNILIKKLEKIYDKFNEKEDNKRKEILLKDIERIKEKIFFPSFDKYLPYLEETTSFIDYINDDYFVFFDNPSKIKESADLFEKDFLYSVTDMLDRGIIIKSTFKYFLKFKEFISKLDSKNLIGLCPFSNTGGVFKSLKAVSFTAKSLNSFNGKFELLYDSIKFYKNNKYKIMIFASGESRAKNLTQQLLEENITGTYKSEYDSMPEFGQIFIYKGSLSRGFEYPLTRTVLISDKEIFGSSKKKRKRKDISAKDKILNFTDLNIGDYVVHQNHGIGKYAGIKRLSIGGVKKDYLKIDYKGSDCLYVLTDQLKYIYKYTGSQNAVRINRLDGQEWKKTKERVAKSCKDMAEKLIALYAKRESLKGISFLPDTDWQKDFETSFPFEETDDQIKSIEEIKADMEKDKPMDRLLCGDVGYGKTEVAMRAAFKAVMSGYQVAYLVPTTILANQHYSNFKQRMNGFGINVAMLSRFVSPSEQKNVIENLNKGLVDIVIGTHKLLNKNIVFKKLGLLIIDEEQRFGVSHKEKIKELKNEIDVLTLSATPIPRTLHMSLSGIRDMSVISTPPENRYPISTFVLEYDLQIIREAILKEISRSGQVYYLFNKVEGIEAKVNELKTLIPEARIVSAHGKMSESQLENIMCDVLEGEIDVLVCTTIIETGLDIPNVNTIIIEDAERLGLSQLYQLNGRVGRSDKLAYSYLTYKKNKVLTEDAQKRLMAIREFTGFGSGFKIAMKDLEIRGTGNVVGPQQSGNMDVVGYDLYCKLLSQAISKLKGIEEKEEKETTINLEINAFIPENYIFSHEQRIDFYKKISAIENKEDLLDLYDEALDRFGDVPDEVYNLMYTALVRFTASIKGFTEIKTQNNELFLFFLPDAPPDFTKIFDKIKQDKNIFIRNTKKPHILYKLPVFNKNIDYFDFIFKFISDI